VFTVTIAFLGLITLVFQSPTDSSVARALFLPADGHTQYIAISKDGYDHGRSLSPDKGYFDDNGDAWFRWNVAEARITLDSSENHDKKVKMEGDLENLLIDPQGASQSIPNMKKGAWDDVLTRFEVTGGTFSADKAKTILARTGRENQIFAYRADDGHGHVKDGTKMHQAVSSFDYKTKASKIMLGNAKGADAIGTIFLTAGASIKFVNEAQDAMDNDSDPFLRHLKFYWQYLFDVSDADQYLPYETRPGRIRAPKTYLMVETKNLLSLLAAEDQRIKMKLDTKYYPKAPDRCPPPKAYVKYN
jgi:hypothetical protein